MTITRLILLLLLLPVGMVAQTTVPPTECELVGAVKSAKDSIAVPYAHWQSSDVRWAGTVGAMGEFSIRLEEGDTIEVTAVGYVPQLVIIPIDCPQGEWTDVWLEPDTLQLPSVTVKGLSYQQFKRNFENMGMVGADTTNRRIPGTQQYRGVYHAPPPTVMNPASLVHSRFSKKAVRARKMNRARKKIREVAELEWDEEFANPTDTLREKNSDADVTRR